MIAALYVESNGCYSGLEGVDAWPEERDARLYAGPFRVVAHPPCQRWGKMWFGQPLTVKRTGVRKKKGDESFEDLVKTAAVRIKPTNNPQIFPDKEFVSPVGIDATDGIVVGIIRGQVRKVGKLLQSQSLRKDGERELGELPSLVKLNTACSGTDAPSIGKLAKVRFPGVYTRF